MSTIRYVTDDLVQDALEDETILQASRRAGIQHTSVCGGRARCSTCRVHVTEGLENLIPRNESEQRLADTLRLPDDIRLACQTRIRGDIAVRRAVVDELDIAIVNDQFADESGTALGRETNAAILFTDLVNYTEFAATLPAYDVVHVLTRYYRSMNGIIEDREGVISDVAGDGILALFGVLEERENPVLDAVEAVRAMKAALVPFNAYLDQMYGQAFAIRAGIHYGGVIVGNFDTGRMRKVAAIGDVVNMASRIETANKDLGTTLLVSEAAYGHIEAHIEARPTPPTILRGKEGRHVLYSVPV